MTAVKIFYEGSRACVRVGRGESDWFEVDVGLRQDSLMSPWLFSGYMDGVVREVNANVQGEGLVMLGMDGGEWRINHLLFADDTALVAGSEENLKRLVEEFGRVCKSWGHTLMQRVASVLISVTLALEPVAGRSPLPRDTGPE